MNIKQLLVITAFTSSLDEMTVSQTIDDRELDIHSTDKEVRNSLGMACDQAVDPESLICHYCYCRVSPQGSR